MQPEMKQHIPDEYIAVWKKMSLEELMQKSERLMQHIDTITNEDQREEMEKIFKWLTVYIDARATLNGVDLDVLI